MKLYSNTSSHTTDHFHAYRNSQNVYGQEAEQNLKEICHQLLNSADESLKKNILCYIFIADASNLMFSIKTFVLFLPGEKAFLFA